jgi:hypothetical protein
MNRPVISLSNFASESQYEEIKRNRKVAQTWSLNQHCPNRVNENDSQIVWIGVKYACKRKTESGTPLSL